jgi:cytochrome P450
MSEQLPFPHAIQESPYPWYKQRRGHAPVASIQGRDEWFLSRWEDIDFVTEHPELFSSALPHDGRGTPVADDYGFDYSPVSMANSDGPEHHDKRLAGLKLIGRGRLRAIAPTVERVADELIDGFVGNGEAEFVSQFSDWLPVRVIADVLGFPQSDVPELKVWSNRAGQGARYLTDEELAEENARVAGITPYLREAILERHERPRDDGLSTLVHEQVKRDGALNLTYLMAEANVLLFAGNATTTHMLGSTLMLLLQNPEMLAHVDADRTLIRLLLEESLRLESPVQFTQRRCVRDVELGGITVPAGTVVLCGWASGNRDGAQWDEADEMRLDRPGVAKQHLAFGRGRHLCLGAALARMEGEIAFRRVLTRLRNLRLAAGKNDFRHIDHPHLRAPRAVYIEFDVAA